MASVPEEEIRTLISSGKIVVRILVQPTALFVIRENLVAPIVGETSTPSYSTVPVIQIEGWKDPVKITVSCITYNAPYKCHPFILIDRYSKCRYGVHTQYLQERNMNKFAVLSGVGLKILPEQAFAESLQMRRDLNANPFDIDCNPLPVEDWSKLRLCFQGYVKTQDSLLYNIPLIPVLSDVLNLLIIDPYGNLQSVSPIVIRSFLTHEENSERDSSSVGTSSAPATQRETQRESLEQELPSSAAAGNSSEATLDPVQVFYNITKEINKYSSDSDSD